MSREVLLLVDALAREVERRMAERLNLVRVAPRRILDAGCGTGIAGKLLADRGYRKLYLQTVTQADQGVDFDFLRASEQRGTIPGNKK